MKVRLISQNFNRVGQEPQDTVYLIKVFNPIISHLRSRDDIAVNFNIINAPLTLTV